MKISRHLTERYFELVVVSIVKNIDRVGGVLNVFMKERNPNNNGET